MIYYDVYDIHTSRLSKSFTTLKAAQSYVLSDDSYLTKYGIFRVHNYISGEHSLTDICTCFYTYNNFFNSFSRHEVKANLCNLFVSDAFCSFLRSFSLEIK